MKAVVFHEIGDIRLDEVAEPIEAFKAFDRRDHGWIKVELRAHEANPST
jgi:hypothetical protein